MYPLFRLAKEFIVHRKAAPLGPLGTHVSHHRCWPIDIDMYMEMNNGRILTILDLGRQGLAIRAGMLHLLKEKKWGLTIAGNSVRYRKRIRPFAKFRMVTQVAGWDHRFAYIVQSIWIGEDCAVQALLRSAITDKNGIVAPEQLFTTMDTSIVSPTLPDWVQAWIDADATRPWPPVIENTVS